MIDKTFQMKSHGVNSTDSSIDEPSFFILYHL